MSRENDAQDKRQSFRWPVTGPRQSGELRFGARRVHVHLLDESAGGFSALMDQPLGIELGTKGLLNVSGDWCEVRVVNLSPVQRSPLDGDDGCPVSQLPETAPFSDPVESAPPLYRIGLTRLDDAFDPDAKSSYYSLAGLTCHLKHAGSGTMGIVVVGLMLAAAVTIIPCVAIDMISSNKADDGAKAAAKWLERDAKSVEKIIDTNRPGAAASGNGRPSREPTALSSIGSNLVELRKSVERMPGAMPFVLPDVVKHLQLTPAQQKRIQELVDAAAAMIRDLAGSSNSAVNRSSEKKILNDTRRKVLDLLDGDQKKKWNELSGESNEPKN